MKPGRKTKRGLALDGGPVPRRDRALEEALRIARSPLPPVAEARAALERAGERLP